MKTPFTWTLWVLAVTTLGCDVDTQVGPTSQPAVQVGPTSKPLVDVQADVSASVSVAGKEQAATGGNQAGEQTGGLRIGAVSIDGSAWGLVAALLVMAWLLYRNGKKTQLAEFLVKRNPITNPVEKAIACKEATDAGVQKDLDRVVQRVKKQARPKAEVHDLTSAGRTEHKI